ncbi:hypothetical protein SAMN05660297_01607 [Natronincola peptidivorans]|uniref:Uncharacterized protein n=1 Tax=Natronincola peptidivorans TaxID=426128 RepID=A0A1I0CEJ7_9FIRM|nr:hypothetical protein [Natronincola peptidivorans]SET17528.1 hypothetical protein SAMN05660297_01607 [Natronincola peptidivorans]
MKNEELLKNIIRVKLQTMDVVTDMLPKEIREPVEELQRKLIKTIHEATEEYVEKSDIEKKEKKIKTIEIE